jgi:hypothetical protein
MNKKIEVKQEGVKIIVDFQTVWAFAWRYYAIVFGIAFFLGMIVTMFS